MLSFIKTIVCYISLCLFRWSSYTSFVNHVLQYCRKWRFLRINLPGLPDALDEITNLPDDVADDLEFVGFNSSGLWLSVRTQRQSRQDRTKTYSHVLAEIPGIGTFRYENTTIVCGTAGRTQRGAKLSLDLDKAMKHWRVQFNGPLEPIGADGTDAHVHGVVSLYWQCTSDPFSQWATPTTWQLAKSMSGWGLPAIISQLCDNKRVCYEQWGQLWGRIDIEGHEPENVRLMSCKRRELVSVETEGKVESPHSTYLVTEVKGLQIMYRKSLQDDSSISGSFGFVTYPISASHMADVTHNSDDDISGSQSTTVMLQTSNTMYSLKLTARKHSVFDESNDNHIQFVKFDMDGRVCYGVETVRKRHDFALPEAFECNKLTHNRFDGRDDDTMIVPLGDCMSTQRALCGGKCASLAVLTQSGFRVPTGICVTVNSFQQHIHHTRKLQEAIEEISACLENVTVHKLQVSCSRAVDACMTSQLQDCFKSDIREQLEQCFGSAEDISLAVRSSAVSEDGSEASAAGQLDTVLGVRGLDQLYSAVIKCWASSLAFRVVEYRRQNGQPLTEPIAILLQTMVAADSAGVVFTNDPTTGNPCVMVVNAAPGIGEAVVSGTVDPDTIRVRRHKHNLNIIEYAPGDKRHKLVLNPTDGVQWVEISDNKANEQCLENDDVLRICELGLQIEYEFDNFPQDIEWAMKGNDVYILQSRTIVRTDIETDEEIAHEFESPIVSDEIFGTSCNCVEACPEILCPLGSVSQDMLAESGIKKYNSVTSRTWYPQFPDVTVLLFTQRFLVNLTAWDYTSIKLFGNKMDVEVAFTGQVIKENTDEKVLECFGESHSSTLWKCILFILSFVKAKRISKYFNTYWTYANNITFEERITAKDQYDKMYDTLCFVRTVWYGYVFMLNESSKWAAILMKVLMGDTLPSEMPLPVKSDMALLLADCPDVESADIPRSIEKLVKLIWESPIKDTFIATPVDQLHGIVLHGDSAELTNAYQTFLEKHGHRGPMEYDFSAKSWAMDPVPLLRTIQHMLQTGELTINRKVNIDVDEAVDNMETEQTAVKKYLLRKVFVPYARNGVSARETGKSTVVKAIDAIKRGYWTLARQMVREGRIPDETLLFYFTHQELGQLIEKRSPSLIRRANRRIKVKHIQDETKYPMIFTGMPRQIDESHNTQELPASLTLTGLPVCRGKIQARARVIKKLKEANKIQHGEILITPTTCVGWSPYFPMLGGLVTEVGGLISHGAVIAREYGIPCIVSVAGATTVFQTGDMIELNGTSGTLKLLQRI